MLISNDVNLFLIPKLLCECPYCHETIEFEDFEADDITAKIENKGK